LGGQATLLDTRDHPVNIVFYPPKINLISDSIEDRVRSTLIAVSWLADTPWIHDKPIIDRSFMLDMSVAEYDPVVLIQIGSHLRELRWTYVGAESVRIRMAMHQSIRVLCELCPWWEFSKPLSLFIA
jgi:hypothetical protein